MPSLATMQTGRYPKDHCAVFWRSSRVDKNLPTLASILEENGYENHAFVSHVALSPKTGLDKGFLTYDYSVLNVGNPHLVSTAKNLTDLAISKLSETDEPFFLWIHYFDPHFEYINHEPWIYGEEDLDRYDSEIAHTDY